MRVSSNNSNRRFPSHEGHELIYTTFQTNTQLKNPYNGAAVLQGLCRVEIPEYRYGDAIEIDIGLDYYKDSTNTLGFTINDERGNILGSFSDTASSTSSGNPYRAVVECRIQPAFIYDYSQNDFGGRTDSGFTHRRNTCFVRLNRSSAGVASGTTQATMTQIVKMNNGASPEIQIPEGTSILMLGLTAGGSSVANYDISYFKLSMYSRKW